MNLEGLSKKELVALAKKYSIYYRTESGKGSMSGYENLTKTQLIYSISNDQDYLRDQKNKTRLELLKEKLRGKPIDPDFIMSSILELFGDNENVPTPGFYCTYIYRAKTPGLLYDQHPLIAVLNTTEWGFIGFNFHLNMQRNYTWPEVSSQFCTIEDSEIEYLKSLPFQVLLTNR